MKMLLRRAIVANRGAVSLVTALIAATCVLTAGGSAWMQRSATFDHVLAQAPAQATRLTVRFTGTGPQELESAEFGEAIDVALPPVLDRMVGQPRLAVRSPMVIPEPVLHPGSLARELYIGAYPSSDELVDWVAGRPPEPGVNSERLPEKVADELGRETADVIEIGLTRESARALNMPVGTYALATGYYGKYGVRSSELPVLEVTGIYEPTDPPLSRLDDLTLMREPVISPDGTKVTAGALAANTDTVRRALWADRVLIQWTFPAAGTSISAGLVDELRQDVAQFSAGGAQQLVRSSEVSVEVLTGLDTLARKFLPARRASNATLAVTAAAVAACALLAVALATRVLARRRRRPSSLLRVRGATLRQIIRTRFLEAACATLPGVALGLLVAGLVRGGLPTMRDLVVVAVTGLVCVLTVTGIGVAPESGTHSGPRSTQARQAPQALREAVDGVVVVLAIVGGAILLTRGSIAAGDPLLVLVPILVAAAVTLLATRQLPRLLWGLRRVTAKGRGLTPLVGLGRATAAARASAVPALIVVLAVSVGVLSVAVTTTVSRGRERAAWERVGADIKVEGESFDKEAVRGVRELDLVETVAPVRRTAGITVEGAPGVDQVVMVAADLPALADAVRGAPGPVPWDPASPTDGRIEVVTSPGVVAPDGTVSVAYEPFDRHRTHIVGHARTVPGLAVTVPFILLDIDALRRVTSGDITPNVLLVDTASGAGRMEPKTIKQALGSDGLLADVVVRADVRAQVNYQPMADRTLAGLRLGAVAAGVFAAVGVLLAISIGAAGRRRSASVLRALGASRRQTSMLSAAETTPTVLLAPLVGAATGVLLVRLAGPGLDLRPLAGNPSVLRLRPEVIDLAALAVGTGLVLAIVAVLATTAGAARRRVQPISELDLSEDV